MMNIDQLKYNIEQIETLPTIPPVMRKLLVVIENPSVSLTKICEFISNDPILTSKVLKMVNSPIYGFPGRISSVNQALILLGLNVVKGMLFGVSVFDAMRKAMIGLWEHSVGVAIVSRVIAKKLDLNDVEEVSVGGLLHDIGKVILSLKYTEDYSQALKISETDNIWIGQAEKKIFGINHSSAGAWISEKWHFPKSLIDIIKNHHNPYNADFAPLPTAIVHVADILVRAKGIGFAGDPFVWEINEKAWYQLNLSEEDLFDIYRELDSAADDLDDFFEGDKK